MELHLDKFGRIARREREMDSKAEFGAQQFAAGYANGCADRDELFEALKAARKYVETCEAPEVLRQLDAALAKARGQ